MAKHEWAGRPIADAKHALDLDRVAALKEFQEKLPRHEAEELTYRDYAKRMATEAASHHLSGMKAAVSAGDREVARKHALMYQENIAKLGHSKVGPVPPEVEAHRKKEMEAGKSPLHFRAHKGDLLLLDGDKPSKK